jgi:integrase-like protein
VNDVLTATLQTVKMEGSEGNAVFRMPQGEPYYNFRTAFEHVAQRAGLEDCTFHDLRHTLASRLVMAGVDWPTVKELLEHKSMTMTLRYTYLSIGHKQLAVCTLEQFGEKVLTVFTAVGECRKRQIPYFVDFIPLPGWWNGRHNGLKIRWAVTPVPVRVL